MVATTKKWVYAFEDGSESLRPLLGGKGAGLAEMVRMGLPVPPGFTIVTEASLAYFNSGEKVPEDLWDQVVEYMHTLEKKIGRLFASPTNPLLVSVRSGAPVSMPGMMDTILNLGINDEIVKGVARLMGDERPAWDAYRRFLQIYGKVVLGIESQVFEKILERHKEELHVKQDHELPVARLKRLVEDYKAAIKQYKNTQVPTDPWEQLRNAIVAVFRSWNNPRAITYRNYHAISHSLGTAVSVVAMVYGNLGEDSGTGVLFTRNPSTGAKELFGEYLANAQGEDVVAGIRTPQPVAELKKTSPKLYTEIERLAAALEIHYKDPQDIEFTVEHGRVFLLQTRSAKRTAQASVKIAVDMVKERIISKEDALKRVSAEDLTQLFVPNFDTKALEKARASGKYMGRGFGASPGAATGKAIFDASRAVKATQSGEKVILVRPETNPDDIGGIINSIGVLTSRGGVTSHAAVVTRGLGKPCVVGCEELKVNLSNNTANANGLTVKEGDLISIDGATGEVFAGSIPTYEPKLEELREANTILSWADQVRRLGVMANADTPLDSERAVAMGAQGIGLCRTEHMFLGERRVIVEQLILNGQEYERWEEIKTTKGEKTGVIPEAVQKFNHALKRLEELQTQDFLEILRIMGERPVIIRLLDPPLHEFLPKHEDLLRDLIEAKYKGASRHELQRREAFLRLVESMREANPMMGHRGCRLGITFPAIYDMQVRAIFNAACTLTAKGIKVRPKVMIPLTSHVNELRRLRERLVRIAKEVQEKRGVEVKYQFGTMIEVPRAALTADEIAQEAEFFSFGTNDLTQMTFGFSRDDAEGKFLRYYLDKGILPTNPFASIDRNGVGTLIQIAVERGKKTRPDLEVGICGEHGGDPSSIAFCHQVGLAYVSCSPFRVPVARLAAAQAALGILK